MTEHRHRHMTDGRRRGRSRGSRRRRSLAAEATVFELSWATGSGLPICCISGLAVAEAGRGTVCQAPGGSHGLQTFWEQLLDFLQSGSVDTWDSHVDKQMARWKLCALVCIKKKFPQRRDLKRLIKVVILNISVLVDLDDTGGCHGNSKCDVIPCHTLVKSATAVTAF